ncbi:hypothetical protein C8R47DRAFT_393563 [Mycena vitilis]|nr:hypothetical protein C8R47DRAFT_393563 [Mycena vitilis]
MRVPLSFLLAIALSLDAFAAPVANANVDGSKPPVKAVKPAAKPPVKAAKPVAAKPPAKVAKPAAKPPVKSAEPYGGPQLRRLPNPQQSVQVLLLSQLKQKLVFAEESRGSG